MSDPIDDKTHTARPASDPEEIARRHQTARAREQPDQIGPYKILETLGEGGMGLVYLAEQTKPIHRRVALKIIKLGMDTKQVIARFETEREALALMNHPNVAKVFDAGATETGRPFFVMEYVAGIPITDYCDKHRLTTEERLKLFMQVCHAVQHAHQKGIIHRDIKPSNVLVTVQDGEPTPKVIDFGVAKATQHRLTERTVFTELGQLIGTPGYMSPEQAEMTALDIDTRTDIYSLGVLLYELLVGALPFESKTLFAGGLAEIQRIIREVDPPKPSTKLSSLGEASTAIAHNRRTQLRTLARELRGDIDWIVMKCLEKDRTRRYDTANGLALEIERYLNHEPVLAGPPSSAYRLRKFVRRNRLVVTGVTAIALSLTGGLVGTSLMYFRAQREQVRAEESAAAEAEQRKLADAARLAEADQRVLAEENEAKAKTEADRALKQRDKAERVATFISETLKGVRPSVALGRDATMLREMMDAAAKRIYDGELNGAPEAELQLRGTIGNTYQELGVYDRAGDMLEPAPALARRVYGDEHPDVATSLDNLAWLLQYQNKFSEAEPLLREALAMRRKLLGEEHTDVATSLSSLAFLLQGQGKLSEAESLCREALEKRRKLLGEEHPDVFHSLNNLASLLKGQGKLSEAEPLCREALEKRRKLLGEEHPDVAQSLNSLAFLLQEQGKFSEAEPLYREALAMYRKLLGEENPRVATSLNNLASVLQDQGKLSEAEPYIREALAMSRKLLGEEHPNVAASLNNLACLLAASERWNEAEQVALEANESVQAAFPEAHWRRGQATSVLGSVLAGQGKFAEAEPLLLGGYTQMQNTQVVPSLARLKEALDRIIYLYTKWDAAESGKGYAEKAAEWRGKLDEKSKSQNVETSKTDNDETPKSKNVETSKP